MVPTSERSKESKLSKVEFQSFNVPVIQSNNCLFDALFDLNIVPLIYVRIGVRSWHNGMNRWFALAARGEEGNFGHPLDSFKAHSSRFVKRFKVNVSVFNAHN